MKQTLQNNLTNLTRYVQLAYTHKKNHHYADSLTNMRKSGEVICKVIIAMTFDNSRYNNLVSNKSYKDLILLLIDNRLTNREIINWLETLQIHGNFATHDGEVLKGQADYGLIALQLLTTWLYKECLKTPIPKKLSYLFNQSDKVTPNKSKKEASLEFELLQKEKDLLMAQLDSLSIEKEQEAQSNTKLQKNLKETKSKIESLNSKLLIKEIDGKKNIVKPKVSGSNKNQYWGWAFFLIAILAIVYLIFPEKSSQRSEKNTTQNIEKNQLSNQTTDNNTEYKVGLYNLNIIEDNPNLNLKIEEVLYTELTQRLELKDVPVSIVYNSNTKPLTTFKEALITGQKEQHDLVLFGNLLEPLFGQNGEITLKYKTIKNQLLSRDFVEKPAFFQRISDSAFHALTNRIEHSILIYYGYFLRNNNKHADVLKLAKKLNSLTPKEIRFKYGLIIRSHINLKNFDLAIKEVNKYMIERPGFYEPYEFMAYIQQLKGDRANALINYKIALEYEPNNYSSLLAYSKLLYPNSTDELLKIRTIILDIVKKDSINFSSSTEVWHSLASIETKLDLVDDAIKHHKKVLQLDSNYHASRIELSVLLCYSKEKYQETLEHLFFFKRHNINYQEAFLMYSKIYSLPKFKNEQKALYYRTKAASNSRDSDWTDNYLIAERYFENQQFKAALGYYLKALSLKKTIGDADINSKIAICYLKTENEVEGISYVKKALEQDSSNSAVIGYAGIFYLESKLEKNNFIKAHRYLTKAHRINPYDTQILANLYIAKKELGKSKDEQLQVLLKYFALDSNNNQINLFITNIYSEKKDYQNALKYLELLIDKKPNEAKINIAYATCLMNISPENDLLALKHARIANSINPTQPSSLWVYSNLLMRNKQYKEAKRKYDYLIKLAPSYKNHSFEVILNQNLDRY